MMMKKKTKSDQREGQMTKLRGRRRGVSIRMLGYELALLD